MSEESSDNQDLERTVCFCHNVCAREIIEAIRNGALTIGEIQSATLASTGCGGCECEVQEILDGELARLPKKASGE